MPSATDSAHLKLRSSVDRQDLQIALERTLRPLTHAVRDAETTESFSRNRRGWETPGRRRRCARHARERDFETGDVVGTRCGNWP